MPTVLTAEKDSMLRAGREQVRDAKAVRRALEAHAKQEHLSMSEVVRAAVREYLRARNMWPPTGGQVGGSKC